MKRLVETDRWRDNFFIELSPYAKLLLSFFYDTANESGIVEIVYSLMEVQLKMNKESIKNAILELQPLLLSDSKNKLFIKDFLKHQMKLPLKRGSVENNWIISKLESNLQRFNNAPEIQEILNNIEEEKHVDSPKKTIKSKKETPEVTPPTINEFIDFFIENGYKKEVAEKSWNGYNDANWHDSRNNKVFNWKQKVRNNWFSPENKEGATKGEKKSKIESTMSVVEKMTTNPNSTY